MLVCELSYLHGREFPPFRASVPGGTCRRRRPSEDGRGRASRLVMIAAGLSALPLATLLKAMGGEPCRDQHLKHSKHPKHDR